jgi:hypothetical protein
LQNKLKKDSSNVKWQEAIAKLMDTARPFTAKDVVKAEVKNGIRLNFTDKDYKNFEEYDSTEKTLPPSKRDGWLVRRFVKLDLSISERYRDNPEEAGVKLVEGFYHRLPYMLFVSLPLFALILKLVYIRRKQFYFADHGVFTIHHYIFSFIVLLIGFGLDKLQMVTGSVFLDIIKGLLFFWLICYLYLAMHNFYKQGWGKTFIKFLIVAVLTSVMMMILFAFFLLFSAFTI